MDIKQYLPGFQRSIPIFRELLDDWNDRLSGTSSSWRERARKLPAMQNPEDPAGDQIDNGLLPELGLNLGYPFSARALATEAQRRRQLRFFAESLRYRGTYNSLLFAQFVTGTKLSVYDMYTEDYSDFRRVEEWFVGRYSRQPYSDPGGGVYLPASAYKSPHFLVSINLNSCQTVDGRAIAIDPERLALLYDCVERNRPINSVPHYEVYLEIHADVCGTAVVGGCGNSSVGSPSLLPYFGVETGISPKGNWLNSFRFEIGSGREGEVLESRPGSSPDGAFQAARPLTNICSDGTGLTCFLSNAGETDSGVWLEAVLDSPSIPLATEVVLYNSDRSAGVDAIVPAIMLDGRIPLRIRWYIDRCCGVAQLGDDLGTSAVERRPQTACCTPLDRPEAVI